MFKYLLSIILVLFSVTTLLASNNIVSLNQKLIEVIQEDNFSPPVASRVHLYPNLIYYEIVNNKANSLFGKIKGMPKLKTCKNIIPEIAATTAFVEVAKKLVYSQHLLDSFLIVQQAKWATKNWKMSKIRKSIRYGHQQATRFSIWILEDMYSETRTYQDFVLSDSLGAWQPTAPEYMKALEPHWNKINTMILKGPEQVAAKPNLTYSENPKSPYMKAVYEVLDNSKKLDTAKKLTALYWDDNPNITITKGHMMIKIHKVSPAGHWMNITGQHIKQLQLNEAQASKLYTFVTVGMYDAFIAAWDTKYKTNSIRPETVINRLIDPDWRPFLETPSFPEYTSGHSTVSSAAAHILYALTPQPMPFVDSTETAFGYPPRKYITILEAADEVSLSRFYGGIHYMHSLLEGQAQGKKVAELVLDKLK